MSTCAHSPVDQMFQIPSQSHVDQLLFHGQMSLGSLFWQQMEWVLHCFRKLGYRRHLPFRWQKGSLRQAGLCRSRGLKWSSCHVSAIQPAFVMNRTEDHGSPLLSFVLLFWAWWHKGNCSFDNLLSYTCNLLKFWFIGIFRLQHLFWAISLIGIFIWLE
jgi:hypothetical protein